MELKVLPTGDQSFLIYITCNPILEYGCTLWFPHFQKDIYAIEMVQWRATGFIFNDHSYNTSVTSLLNTLNWPILRINLIAIMLYKIVNNLIDIPADSYLLHNSSPTTIATGYHTPGSVPRVSNHLIPRIACSPSLKIFQDKFQKRT